MKTRKARKAQKAQSKPVVPPEELEEQEQDDAIIGHALRWSLVALVLLAAVGGVVAYVVTRPPPAAPVVMHQTDQLALRTLPPVEIPSVRFTDVTESAGIDWVHETGAMGEKLLPETMGGGCAFLDYNNSGHQDILLVNSTRWPWDRRPPAERPATLTLYRNDGHGNFEDVTAEVGLDVELYGMGVAVGDYDNDGWVDIFISALGYNRLFRNLGGRFQEVTFDAGVAGAEDEWSVSAGFFDFNNNGYLDLFVTNYVRWSREIDLGQDFRLVGVGRAYGPPTAFQGTFPYLYRNNGDGTFTDISAEAGIQVTNPLTGVPMAKSMGLIFADLNNNGWMDVVVANDTVQNFVFQNVNGERFEEVGALVGVAFAPNGQARGAMGIFGAHFRNDHSFGIAIGNFANEMTALYVSDHADLQFVDSAISTGLGPPTRLDLTFGVFFFDYDLDGRLDLLSANGHLEHDINKVQASQHYEQPAQLFWNAGPEHPTEFLRVLPEKVGPDFHRPIVGRGAAYADIDGDGDLDVLLISSGGRPLLLRNDQQLGHNWLRVKLVGTTSNRDAIGARVTAHVGGQRQERAVMPTGSYLSQMELPLTFGLGTLDRVERLDIRWPDGSTQTVHDPQINQLHVIEQLADGLAERGA